MRQRESGAASQGWNWGANSCGHEGVGGGKDSTQGSGLVIGWMVRLSEDLGRGEGLRKTLSLSGSC